MSNLLITSALFVALCPPTIVGFDLEAERPSVTVVNECGADIDLGLFSLRIGAGSWNQTSVLADDVIAPNECFTYYPSIVPVVDGCSTGVAVFDVCDDINEEPPLMSLGVEWSPGDDACGLEFDDISGPVLWSPQLLRCGDHRITS